jgi:ribosomal protein L7Ae-like RNA K-turn-binding protein
MAGKASEESSQRPEVMPIKKKHYFEKREEAEADPRQSVLTLLQFARKAGKMVHGFEACKREVTVGKVKLLLLTVDIAKNTKDKMKRVLKMMEATCPVFEFGTQEELSDALGLPFTGIIGILDNNFAQKILSYLEQLV